MAKVKKNKEAGAKKIKIEEINRLIGELWERIKLNQEEIKESRKAIEELESRKRKLRNLGNKTFSWDEDTPMIKLINMSQLHKLKKLFDIWQNSSDEKLDLKTTARFEFNLANKKQILLALDETWKDDTSLFKISQRQVLMYLSEHSNLGKADTLKKIIYRNTIKKVGT
ncbi:MAG: hypothetical protein IJQ60_02085 [Prevotella sp.]|nr:hypothetical protein [Prevotella sp.]